MNLTSSFKNLQNVSHRLEGKPFGELQTPDKSSQFLLILSWGRAPSRRVELDSTLADHEAHQLTKVLN